MGGLKSDLLVVYRGLFELPGFGKWLCGKAARKFRAVSILMMTRQLRLLSHLSRLQLSPRLSLLRESAVALAPPQTNPFRRLSITDSSSPSLQSF